jgi:hypothetical protein
MRSRLKENPMRKFLLAAAFLALTPALAQAHAGPAVGHGGTHAIHREVVRERHEVREDRRELRHDRHELRRDRRELHRARVVRARAWHRHHHNHG